MRGPSDGLVRVELGGSPLVTRPHRRDSHQMNDTIRLFGSLRCNQPHKPPTLNIIRFFIAMLTLTPLVTACDPANPPLTLKIRGAANPELGYVGFPAHAATSSVDASRMGALVSDLGTLEHNLDRRFTVFLLEEDIGGEIGATVWRHAYVPNAASLQTPSIFSLSPSNISDKPWQSVRVYDQGTCSTQLPLDFFVALFPDRFEMGANDMDGTENVTLEAFRVVPLLRAPDSPATILTEVADSIHVDMVWDADVIEGGIFGGDVFECNFPRVTWSFDVVPRMGQGSLETFCPALGTTPGFFLSDDEFDQDLHVFVENFNATVNQQPDSEGRCRDGFQSRIEENMEASVPSRFSSQISRQILENVLTVSPETLNMPADVPCSCDLECSAYRPGGNPFPGRMSGRCVEGKCHVVLHPQRVAIRPDRRLDLVWLESTADYESAYMTGANLGGAMCDPTRFRPQGTDVTVTSVDRVMLRYIQGDDALLP